MKTLIALCLRQRVVVLGFACVLVLLGIWSTSRASFDAFPEFSPPRVEIQTEALGLSSEEVELLVTSPLESSLTALPGLVELRSKSVLGLSSVLLVFEQGTNLLEARALVSERISRVELPSLSRRPVVLSPLSSTSRVLKIGVSSKKLSQMELSDLVRWVVRPRLMSVEGVANVAIWGERRRQLQVRVDPDRLAALGLSVDDVIVASQGAVTPTAGGFVDSKNQRLPVLHPQMASSATALGKIPVGRGKAGSVELAEVAEVLEAPAAPIGEGLVTSGTGLLLIVEKQPGANTLEVTYGVEAALKGMGAGLPDVETDTTIFRPAGFIERALTNLGTAMGIGTILVVLILFLFLWDLRTALISIVAIPTSLLAASSVLSALGIPLDTMVIAGFILALGEVVDDAIIDVENIHKRLAERTEKLNMPQTLGVVLDAAVEVRSAVVYATIIVGLGFLPVLFLPGVSGAFFRPLALGYGLAVIASLAVALTLTPVLSFFLLPGHLGERRSSPADRWLRPKYEAVLHWVFRRNRQVFACTAFVFLAAVSALSFQERIFLPDFAENDFLMHWIGKPGTSLEEMKRTADLARKELLAIEGVRNFGAHIGRAEVADEVVGPNFAELWISVDPEADLPRTMNRVKEVVEGYPGIYRDVQTYLKERMREVLSGGSSAITVRLYGQDLEQLSTLGDTLAKRLEALPAVVHASPASQVMVPQIEIIPDLERTRALGIDPARVTSLASVIVQGKRVGTVVRGQQPMDVVVWGTPETRESLSALSDLLVDVDGGPLVRLGDVATVRLGQMRNTVTHQAGSRKIDISLELKAGGDLVTAAAAIDEVTRGFPFPAGFHAETLGEHRAQADSTYRLLGISILALLGVFFVLLADFRSPLAALLVMTCLPLALVGAVLFNLAAGGVISLGTLVGFVTVLGVSARNSIILMAQYFRQFQDGRTLSPEMLIDGASERLAPILMTALSTGLALIPIVLAGNTAGHEIEFPMAVVILGGLFSSTAMTLLVLPGLVWVAAPRLTRVWNDSSELP